MRVRCKLMMEANLPIYCRHTDEFGYFYGKVHFFSRKLPPIRALIPLFLQQSSPQEL